LRIRRRPEEKARIELVPMIDTMAFLLVFFMIASLAMTQQAGMSVNLPHAGTADSASWGDRSLVVTVDVHGKLYLDKDPVSQGDLVDAVRARLARNPELVVVINADESVQHREVVGAMDAVKKAGASRMAIATLPAAEYALGP